MRPLGDKVAQLPVHNFSHGLLNPGLGYLLSCLGSFIGLRCLTRARAYTGWTRAIWLLLASVAIGATGIWLMHFIAMLGFSIPGQEILYNVPITLVSLLVAVLVVALGLFIVGYGGGGLRPVLAGGVIIGIGVAVMYYVGMSAISMQGTVRYNPGLVAISVLIAIVAGTAALLAGLYVSGTWASVGVSLIMGVAVTGMHYTGMAAMHVFAGGGTAIAGSSAGSFLFPLLLGAVVLTFLLAMIIAMSPNEEEIRADQSLSERLRPVAVLNDEEEEGKQRPWGHVSAAQAEANRAWAHLAEEVDASRAWADAGSLGVNGSAWANAESAGANTGSAANGPTANTNAPTGDLNGTAGKTSGAQLDPSRNLGNGGTGSHHGLPTRRAQPRPAGTVEALNLPD
jgi:NO-binding membrane sensor protein with MHYT domain